MNANQNQLARPLRPKAYWRLWVLKTLLLSAGMLLLLAMQYGTVEFLGRACAMALLPCIPLMVLVGGTGSSFFVLTKVLIEKRGLRRPAALALLVGPALVIALLLATLGLEKSPMRRLSYLCAGHAPATATAVRLAGYSTFLREEWLAVFHADEKSFRTFVADAKLAPADGFEFGRLLAASALRFTGPGKSVPSLANALCFKRAFKPDIEHERGTVFAVFDPATATAAVLREYRD